MLPLVREHLHSIDLIAPDIYTSGYRDLHRLCKTYSADGNPLYIAEHSTPHLDEQSAMCFTP